jgi:activator of HSP90 ATPase
MQTKTIKQCLTIKASAHDIYEALMDSEKHSQMTGEKARISREVGGKFTAYDGYASGENLELVPDKKIVQTWRASDWPKGHYSKMIIILNETRGTTDISFVQEDVPEEFYDDIYEGWFDYYWEPLKQMLEE